LRVLVVNAGSSSLKLRLLDRDDRVIGSADLPGGEQQLDSDAIAEATSGWLPPDAVGHRVVHGGARFREAVRIEPEVETAMRELIELAPLHQPRSLAAIDAVTRLIPDAPAIACFDTAFHSTLPEAAATYALPTSWRDRYGLRRFGFHGLSHSYVSRRASELLGRNQLRIVSCHLGAGASLAAIESGRSIDTTMGFTPLEGLVMATRSGSVDPGLLLWLLQQEGITEAAMADVLEYHSGLQGLANESEMAPLLERADTGDEVALIALEVYLHRLRGGIASMAAALGGLDGLVFTGGVGENSAAIRRRAAEGLGFLGVAIDPDHNADVEGDAEIGIADAQVAVLVVTAREDLEIARQVRRLLT
jgi:acetate kinase